MEVQLRRAKGNGDAMLVSKGCVGQFLSDDEAWALASPSLGSGRLDGKRVLVIIPDSTRTAPLPLFFRLFHERLWGRVAALDYLVALGTHQPMDEEALNQLVGISAEERAHDLCRGQPAQPPLGSARHPGHRGHDPGCRDRGDLGRACWPRTCRSPSTGWSLTMTR